MDGVNILATQEVPVEFVFNWTAWWITVGVFALVGLIIAVVNVYADGYEWWLIPTLTVVTAMFGGVFGLVMGNIFERPVAYETQYKVTISEEVSMTDFLEKYKIVSTEGKIYTVREVKGEN